MTVNMSRLYANKQVDNVKISINLWNDIIKVAKHLQNYSGFWWGGKIPYWMQRKMLSDDVICLFSLSISKCVDDSSKNLARRVIYE